MASRSIATIFLILGLFFINGSYVKAQHKGSFRISGNIIGIQDSSVVFLTRRKVSRSMDTILTGMVINSRFKLEGSLPEGEGDFCFLTISTLPKGNLTMFLDHSSVNIIGKVQDWPKDIIVSGSSSNDDYRNFQKIDRPLRQLEDDALNKWGAEQSQNEAKLISAKADSTDLTVRMLALQNNKTQTRDARMSAWHEFITNHPNSFYSAFLLNRIKNQDNLIWVRNQYMRLTDRVKNSMQGMRLKNDILYFEKNISIAVNNICPDFTSATPSGKLVKLSEEVKKAKFTLIDFWASWCTPCREEFVNVKRLYSAYNNKGFNIIGVSNDTKRASWENAIAKDALPWLNVSDLDGNNGVLAKSFGIIKLPTNFLLDSSGKIIAIDLFEKDLETKLIEVFEQSSK